MILALALRLGYADPDRMLREISARQLAEWRAYFGLTYFGDPADDLRHGLLCHLVDACHRAKGQPMPPRHYMISALGGDCRGSEQSAAEQRQIFAQARRGFARARKRKQS